MNPYQHHYGADERTAQVLNELDAPGNDTISSVLRFRELDERTDGAHDFRLIWDSLSEVLPIVIEVFEVEDQIRDVPVHLLRVAAEDWREAWEHPWAY